MIPRIRRQFALGALLFGAALLTVGCQKVPLLAPSGSTITLTASATALPVNGSTTIIAQVIEAGGTPPHSGTLVTFTTNLGSVQPSEAETDISGRVIVKYVAGTGSGTATITAISGGVSASGTNAIKIAVGAAAVGGVSVSATPQTLPSSGGTSTIVATVFDASGNTVSGVPVSFAIDTSTGSSGAGSLSVTVVNSDAAGHAQTTLTTNRTTTVSATAGVGTPSAGTGSTATTPQSAKVTVTVNTTNGFTIGAPVPASPTVNQVVTFTLTSVPGTTASAVSRVTVEWGDGQTQNYSGLPSSISHSYRSAGSYLIVVTGFDSFGDTSTATQSVTVASQPRPTITVSAPDTTTPGTSTKITINAAPSSSSAPIQQIQVDFGDGQSQTLQGNATSVQHVYQRGGSYTITGVATDSNGASGSGSTVIVVGGGSASFTVSPSAGTTATTFQFNAQDSTPPSGSGTIASYAWDFGDGTSGTGVTTSRKYTSTGTFTVRLTITDSNGATATTTKTVTVT